jgi:hypothetical protein
MVLLAAACGGTGGGDPEARQAVSDFYKTYIELHPSGVPDGEVQKRLAPLVSARLATLLKQADAAEQSYYRTTRGEAPPLVEGDIFTSLFEGASSFELGSCSIKADAGSCELRFSYIDPAKRATQQWRDRALIVRDASGWRLDDVEYGGNWEFMHKGSLSGLLEQVIRGGGAPSG